MSADTATAPRLKARYRAEIAPALVSQFAYKNPMQVPGLVKVIVNMGVGEAARDSKLIEGGSAGIQRATRRRPCRYRTSRN